VKNVAWRLKELHVCVVTLLFSLIGKYALIADKGFMQNCAHSAVSSMEADAFFCPDCGNPRTGIICPDCNTLNFRSFCRKCNRPLNEMAMQEMQKAKKDPVFQEMLALAQELADLEEQILNTVSEEIPVGEPELPPVELSEADKKLIQQYKDLFSGSSSLEGMQVARPEPKVEEPVQTRPKIQLNVKKVDLDEAKQSYKEKLEEMKLLMEKLRPEGDMTPEDAAELLFGKEIACFAEIRNKSACLLDM